MELMYSSTRNGQLKFTASQAILKGLADDGGLFVPETIPSLDVSMDELANMSYQEVAYAVMKKFFTDFTEEELKNCIDKAYDSKFDTEEIAPLVDADGAYYLELFHGPTIAFKDMALQILPHLLITSARKNNVKNDIVILTATSGDTGKAALAGFACSGKVSCRGPGNDFGCRNTDQGYSDTPYRGSKQSYLYEKGMGDDEDPRGCYASGGAGK